jgi:hypothetical protein
MFTDVLNNCILYIYLYKQYCSSLFSDTQQFQQYQQDEQAMFITNHWKHWDPDICRWKCGGAKLSVRNIKELNNLGKYLLLAEKIRNA